MFKVGDIVTTLSTGGIKPPLGTVGVVSHYGVDNIDPSVKTLVVAVRFEDYPSAIYYPDDLTVLMAPPPVDLEKVRKFKPGEFVVLTETIHPPYCMPLRPGHCLAVDNQIHEVLSVSYSGGPIFDVRRDKVQDSWDTRITPQRDTIPTPPIVAVVYCALKTCKSENDYSPSVKTCWRCGNSLQNGTVVKLTRISEGA